MTQKKVDDFSNIHIPARYYGSGILFAAALSIIPALFASTEVYGRGLPFGMPTDAMFFVSFTIIMIISIIYLWVARVFHIQKSNILSLILLAMGETILVVLILKTFTGTHIPDGLILIYVATEILLLIIQVPLAMLHSKFAKKSSLLPY